jgi:iron complex outermembrane receptor protein
MKTKLLLATSALTALGTPFAAHAQSAASTEIEANNEIVVSGTLNRAVEGILIPQTPRARQVLTQEQLSRNAPGQTVLDSINIIPGVSFTNNDAYGSAGGQLQIRGFSSDRISLTFDGIPLNDSGNYAIYSNQQLDPEVIDNVNVILGSTDIDSPTAAATGSTINYQSRTPSEDIGVLGSVSVGDFNQIRVFGMFDTGSMTAGGLRAFVSASKQDYDNPINNYGKVDKTQFNAKIFQPLVGEDYIWVAGHFNRNRNNFFGSIPLRVDTTGGRQVGPGSGNRFPITRDEATYDINFPCAVNFESIAGARDVANSCGTEFDRRYNPSDTGNVRAALRLSLGESLVLTVEPSYQYVKANGGGTYSANEGFATGANAGLTGSFNNGGSISSSNPSLGSNIFFGRDLNGDGDLLDSITVVSPSQTQTDRYGVITNLIYELTPDHRVRVAYTLDHANHRQTAELGRVQGNGEPVNVFPADNPLADVSGAILQRRDRESKAILNQVSAEYRGSFVDNRFNVVAGLRAPFFRRELQNNCFTISAGGNVTCFSGNSAAEATFAQRHPQFQGPQARDLKYDRILPSAGFTFDLTRQGQVFFNYAKGLQVPGTDPLYASFFFAPDAAGANPTPETTDNFDGGVRYTSGRVQAQLVGWYTKYENRLATAYDPELDLNVFRNLGDVKKYGVDGSIGFQVVPQLFVYAFGSYLESEIKDNLQVGVDAAGTPLFAQTAGRRESGAPEYTFGGQARMMLGPVELGATAKRTGGRFIYDTNLPVLAGTAATGFTQIYDAQTPAYWLVNLDARIGMEWAGLSDRTFLQLNVYNVFDELYVGGFNTGSNQNNVLGAGQINGNPGSPVFAQIGAPRTFSVSFTAGF